MSYKTRAYWASLPRLMTATRAGVCAETGAAIKKGDQIAYFPATGKAYCDGSQEAAKLRGQKFAEAYGLLDANH